ncbi:MAG: threonine/serine exporter family protein [Caryophanon sp.]|nr:threonine/serine exporter family protein [Caryophanon sp.]
MTVTILQGEVNSLDYNERTEFAIDCFLLAGRIMMESGAETYRVEDTMIRMAHSQGMMSAQSYVTPTGIIFSLGRTQPTRITSIPNRVTNLHRISLVNTISRKLTSSIITLEEAYDELKKIEKKNYMLPNYVQILAAAIASGCFLIMFQGIWQDFVPAMIAGGLGYWVLLLVTDVTKVKFFSEFIASVAVGVVAALAVQLGVGQQIDTIIIGSVMPLVPGVIITIAIRDLMAGHFTSGLARGIEALLTAFAIGSGIALALTIL